MALIGEIRCTPPQVLPGQSVLIEVFDQDGTPFENNPGVNVNINGVTGAKQYLQFAKPGTERVVVAAVKGKKSELQVSTITVAEATANVIPDEEGTKRLMLFMQRPGASLPMLQLSKSDHNPTLASFAVSAFAVFPEGVKDVKPLILLDQPNARGRALKRIKTSFLSGIDAVAQVRQPPAASDPIYHWDFGDGTTHSGPDLMVEHDFEGSLDPNREQQTFHVSLRIEHDGLEVEVRRSLSVFNAYAISKSLGFVVPKSRSVGFASKLLAGFEASFTVENLESHELILTSRRLLVHADTPSGEGDPGPSVPIEPPIKVPGKSSLVVPIVVSADEVPVGSPGFTAYFAGESAEGLPVRVEASFDVPLAQQHSDALKIGNLAVRHLAVINDLVAMVEPAENPTLAIDPRLFETKANRISTGIKQQVMRNKVSLQAEPRSFQMVEVGQRDRLLVGTALAANLIQPDQAKLQTRTRDLVMLDPALLSRLPAQPAPKEGEPCDPDNIDSNDADWVCQATPETVEKPFPDRFMNARKGDTILSPGGGGIIGRLLRQVTPGQKYAHSGIMTQNRTEVTHSTASEDRIRAYPVGSIDGEPQPSDGHRPDVLKYCWPGVVTQSVQQAIRGENMVDPESQKAYSISAFSPRASGVSLDGKWEMVPPMVVKPDPMLETPALRAKLRAAADDARNQAGKGHYRLFCYTDPTLGLRELAPAEAGWAAGTVPSVCSSFVWMTLKKQGFQLEGANAKVKKSDLEAKDKDQGAEVNAATADGLYLYTAAERLHAGEFLYEYFHASVMDALTKKAGVLGGVVNLFSDMADDVSNQIANTFAKDWSDTAAKDSDEWRRDTLAANAISPDNIMFWDGPDQGGPYGLAVPLVYREARLEIATIYRWRKVLKRGQVTGTVRFKGEAVAGAFVQLYDGMATFTDAAGNYRLEQVPFGSYMVNVAKDGGPLYLSVSVPLELNADAIAMDLELKPPSALFRKVAISGHVDIVDHENLGKNEHFDEPLGQEVYVGPFHTHETYAYRKGMGGEVRFEFDLVFDWNLDKSLNVSFASRLYEGTSEATTDLGSQWATSFNVPEDCWYKLEVNLNADGDAWTTLNLRIDNLVNPN